MNPLLLLALIVDAAVMAVVFVAVIRVATSPRALWPRGRTSKGVWIAAAIWFTFQINGFLVPAGAVLALWHLQRISQPPDLDPPPLPYAEGTPDPDTAGRT